MRIKIYQADAFTDGVFGGNPAAVCPLEEELPEELMQKIAAENNLSETAFIFEKDGIKNIRWFTPACEVDLCGHATLASAHILFEQEDTSDDMIEFQCKVGKISVSREGDLLVLDFPVTKQKECQPDPLLEKALGKRPVETYKSDDILAVFESETEIRNFKPDFKILGEIDTRGVIATAKGDACDFVSRFFGPAVGIDEDPVTGSAHCALTPYWAEKLNKTELTAKQLSERGGQLWCRLAGERVKIAGKAVTYMIGEILL